MPNFFDKLRPNVNDLIDYTINSWNLNKNEYQSILLIEKFQTLNLQPFELDHQFITAEDLTTSFGNNNFDSCGSLDNDTLVIEDKSDMHFDLSSLAEPHHFLKIKFINCTNIIVQNASNLRVPFQFFFQDSSCISIDSITFDTSSCVNVSNCTGISVQNCSFKASSKASLVFLNSKKILLNKLQFYSCDLCSILIGTGCLDFTISNSLFLNGKGKSNWHAPIVISARSLNFLDNDLSQILPDGYWGKPEIISNMINPPRKGSIINNRISFSTSSGIYLDGAVETLLESNIIENCSKEGLCLDYGCLNVFVTLNKISFCGERSNKSDEDLARDFVLDYGRCENGSAKAKLPGISIDNSGFCLIFSNQLFLNYGSGVKTVRTGIANIITANSLLSNNQGQNDVFHFFGIEFGSAPGDVEASDINFIGTCMNVVSRNVISGQHYSSVFIPHGCSQNFFCDNIMMKSLSFSIESLEVNNTNKFLNNFSQTNSRNCSLSRLQSVYAGVGDSMFD